MPSPSRFHNALAHLFTLKRAILGLGLLGILAAGTIALIDWQASRSEEAIRATLARQTTLEERLSQLHKALLLGRRAEKDFVIRREEKYIGANDKAVAQARSTLDQLRGLAAGLDKDLHDRIASIGLPLTAYAEGFKRFAEANIALGLNEKLGLEGELRKAVHAAEEAVRGANRPDLTVLVLMMRRHEKDFMLRGAEKYREELHKRVTEFQRALDTIEDPGVRSAIDREIGVYRARFDAYVEGTLARDTLLAQLSTVYAKIDAIIAALDADIDARTAKTRELGATQLAQQERFKLMAITAAIVLLVSLSLLLMRSISRPIRAMSVSMREIASGNLEGPVPGLERRDEIREMADALQLFRDNAIENIGLRKASEAEQKARRARQDALERSIAAFEGSVATIMSTVASAASELHAAAGSMSEAASETLMQSTSVASAATQAATNVQNVAAAGEELSASTLGLLEQARQANEIARQAGQNAETSSQKVRELSDAATAIGKVIELIRSIAGQTNLLALNATIEAARAGEAGKGFAVVASEVKQLAGLTSKATNDIAGAIDQIQLATGDTVLSIEAITGAIRDVSELSSAMAQSMEEQRSATAEIARNVQQAADGTSEVSEAITHVSGAATSSGSAATQVLAAAGELAQQAETLRAEVSHFLAEARAA